MVDTPVPRPPVPGGASGPRPVRVLDPDRVRRSPRARRVESTTYVADRLIVSGPFDRALVEGLDADERGDIPLPEPEDSLADNDRGGLVGLQRAAKALRYHLVLDAGSDDSVFASDDEIAGDGSFAVILQPDEPDIEPDAWDVVERYAERSGGDPDRARIALDHVLRAHRHVQPFPVIPSTERFATPGQHGGIAEYGLPGWGGRAPVARVGRPPRRELAAGTSPWVGVTSDGAEVRRPVVAVVDTGCGTHPWFGTYDPDVVPVDGPDAVVVRGARLDGAPIGTFPVQAHESEDAEIGGMSVDPLVGPLDPVAGHGTFISGIVHQVAPDAVVLPVRAFGGSGEIAEHDLIRTLWRLFRFHRRGLRGVEGYHPVDAVVLAIGYYHEQPVAETTPEVDVEDTRLRRVLGALGRAGVLVVVSSGNDGTTRPLYPASFAPSVERVVVDGRVVARPAPGTTLPGATVPVLTVGAQNPDRTTALFSNDGPWVTCVRPGAALVSTAPVVMDGPATPTRRLPERIAPGVRATIDPDGFQSGFATWSGTSFAAPHLAAQLANALLEERLSAHDRGSVGAGTGTVQGEGPRAGRVRYAWDAIERVLGLTPTSKAPGGAPTQD